MNNQKRLKQALDDALAMDSGGGGASSVGKDPLHDPVLEALFSTPHFAPLRKLWCLGVGKLTQVEFAMLVMMEGGDGGVRRM